MYTHETRYRRIRMRRRRRKQLYFCCIVLFVCLSVTVRSSLFVIDLEIFDFKLLCSESEFCFRNTIENVLGDVGYRFCLNFLYSQTVVLFHGTKLKVVFGASKRSTAMQWRNPEIPKF